MNIFLLIGTCLFFLLLGFVLGVIFCLSRCNSHAFEEEDDDIFVGAIDLNDEKNKDIKDHMENLIKEIKEDK